MSSSVDTFNHTASTSVFVHVITTFSVHCHKAIKFLVVDASFPGFQFSLKMQLLSLFSAFFESASSKGRRLNGRSLSVIFSSGSDVP